MLKSESKSPLTLLLLIACLVIATLVVFSNYFFRPGLEIDLQNKIISKLDSYYVVNPTVNVEGRDVILEGIVLNEGQAEIIEAEIKEISGINVINNKLLIQND